MGKKYRSFKKLEIIFPIYFKDNQKKYQRFTKQYSALCVEQVRRGAPVVEDGIVGVMVGDRGLCLVLLQAHDRRQQTHEAEMGEKEGHIPTNLRREGWGELR